VYRTIETQPLPAVVSKFSITGLVVDVHVDSINRHSRKSWVRQTG